MRRARNIITSLIDASGQTVETDSGIQEVATNYFQELFQTSPVSRPTEFVSAIPRKVTDEMNQWLSREITEDEVKTALFAMHPEKAPGPDGMTALFYQRFWGEIKVEVVKLVRDFFRTGYFDPGLNLTHICLIPKVEKPSTMGEFRPISLCNISYKIISKVMCFRLKNLMPKLVSETQSAFVTGRLISDNILIAQEMFHGLRTKEKVRKEFLAIKTDMSKAYDRLEWSFLERVLRQLGFHPHWVSCIMWCVTSVSFQVLINGAPKGHIKPQKGLRQGDPLSPYLFILCTEALTANIRKKELNQTLTGLKIAPKSPAISHLLFADDSLFFCKATKTECEVILRLLADYEEASGQMINYDKSSVVFGNKIPNPIQCELKNVLGIQKEGGMGKYLGIPESLEGSKTEVFNYVKESLNNRVTGWSSKLLSKGGKEVMLKSVAFALPNHVMSCFRLPQTVVIKLNSAVSNFWWGSSGTSKGVHWISWDSLCVKKQEGGLGFRSLYDFNTALLAKQLWRLEKYPESLVARVLKGRYYAKSHPFYAPKGNSPSYGWRSLVSAQELVLQGTRWQVGNGAEIFVWDDSWIPDKDPRPALGTGLNIYPNLTASDLLNENKDGWNVPLLNQLLAPEDVLMVRSLPLRPSIQKDRALWHYTKSGDYTVKSGYDLIRNQKKEGADGAILEPSFTVLKAHVWTVDCPSKIQHFLWQVLNGALAVLSGLRKRGLNVDTLCKECGTEEETINHVLFECAKAKAIWTLLHIQQTDLSFPSSSIYVNMDFLFFRPYSWKPDW